MQMLAIRATAASHHHAVVVVHFDPVAVGDIELRILVVHPEWSDVARQRTDGWLSP
jgi:hypothetical protein